MAPELMRKRRMKWEVRIIYPPFHKLPPPFSISTKELEKVLSTIDCFLETEPQIPYAEGYILLRHDLEEKLKDRRFSGHDWWIRRRQVVLDDELRALADRARVDIRAAIKFRQ